MFYENLQAALATVPKADKIVILGDCNTRVGIDYTSWAGVLGKNGISKCCSNVVMELSDYSNKLSRVAENEPLITNTIFRRYKTLWMHPRSKHWQLFFDDLIEDNRFLGGQKKLYKETL